MAAGRKAAAAAVDLQELEVQMEAVKVREKQMATQYNVKALTDEQVERMIASTNNLDFLKDRTATDARAKARATASKPRLLPRMARR